MKKIARFLTILFTLMMLFSVPVYALGGSGDQGDATEGGSDLSGKDGFSTAKSGYIVYTSNANGDATSPIM